MSVLLARIGGTLTLRWKRGLVGLVVALVAIGAIAGSQGGAAAQDFSIPGTESQRAQDLLEARFPAAAGVSSQVVFSARTGKLTGSAAKASVKRSLAALARLPHVTSVSDPLATGTGTLARDGRTAFSTVQYDVQPTDLKKPEGEAFVKAAQTGAGSAVAVDERGPVADIAAQQDAPVGELIGVAIAIVLLTLLFRSLAAMFVTVLGALLGVIVSQLILHAVSKPLGIPDFATTIALMLGLGAGIDYSLLVFSRFREQLANGDSPQEASARASATSGVSVVAAGAIVMVAIAGLLAVGIPLVGKMGVGAAIAVAMVVISSLTALPVLAGMLARRLRPKNPAHVARSAGFARWGERLVARPKLAVIGGGLILVLLSIPMLSLRLGQPDDGNQPSKLTQRRAYDHLSHAFGPGFSGPLLLAIGARNGGRPDRAAVARLSSALRKAPGVAVVGPAIYNKPGNAAILNVTPSTSPQDAATASLVDRVRGSDIPRAVAGSNLQVFVGGQTASFEDFSSKIAGRLPLFIAVVLGLSILLLMAVFRSIWVPLASAVFNLLSIGAAYGVIVAVFQWGWGASLLGVGDNVPVVSFVPLFMFAILFGLSMDYNVFLLSRIREAYFEGDSPAESVVHGLSRIAKVVLVAGLIMASVFLAFMSGSDVVIKMFGLGLGTSILIDVLVVRMIVSPALMALLGDRAWWMPRGLDRLIPDVSLEGGHATRKQRTAESGVAA